MLPEWKGVGSFVVWLSHLVGLGQLSAFWEGSQTLILSRCLDFANCRRQACAISTMSAMSAPINYRDTAIHPSCTMPTLSVGVMKIPWLNLRTCGVAAEISSSFIEGNLKLRK